MGRHVACTAHGMLSIYLSLVQKGLRAPLHSTARHTGGLHQILDLQCGMQDVRIAFIAAGSAACHCLAGGVDGKLYTWGRNEVSSQQGQAENSLHGHKIYPVAEQEKSVQPLLDSTCTMKMSLATYCY